MDGTQKRGARRRKPSSLSLRVAVAFFMIALVVSLLVGAISYAVSNAVIKEAVREKSIATAQTLANSINTFLGNANQASIGIYSGSALHKRLNLAPAELGGVYDRAEIEKNVADAKIVNNSILFVNIYGTNGFALTDMYYKDSQPRSFLQSEAYYALYGLVPEQTRALILPFLRNNIAQSTRNTIHLVRYIRNIWSLETIGIMTVGIGESALCKQYNAVGTDCMILDGEGRIVSHKNKSLLGKRYARFDALTDMHTGSNAGTAMFSEDGRRYFCSYARISETGWYFLNVEAYYSVFDGTRAVRNSILIILLIAALLSLVLVLYFSKRITSSVTHLLNTMHLAKHGDLTARYTMLSQDDEINRLGAYLNGMLDQIEEHLRMRERAAEQQRDADIKLLQAQINPHLLYNTLDSVHYYLESGNIGVASDTLRAMSKYFKLTLSKGQFLIPLAREIELIRSYLEIQRLCREKNIPLIVTCPDALLSLPIPKMTLQPIVENAVLHGYELDSAEGGVEISVNESGAWITISVLDHGVGMTEEQLAAVNESLRRNDGAPEHFGLWNVNMRLCHLYGDGAGLAVESEFGVYTRAILTIPSGEEANT